MHKGYKQTEIGMIPEEWCLKTLKTIAPLQRGFDLPYSKMEDGKYPVVFSNGIGAYHAQYMVKGPGVVTGRSGTIGKIHYVDNNYWPHNTALWVTSFCGNYPKYIFYLFNTINWELYNSGSGVPTLNRNDVHDLKCAIPSFEEQQHIAEALSDVDSMISSLEKLIAKKKAVKQGAMQELLTGKKRLPGFWGKWESKGNIFSFAKGTQINNSLLNEMDTYPVYNGGREPSGFTDSFNCTGTIIISEGGNSCGFVNRTKQNFWAGGHCYYIYESDLNFDFLYHLLKFCENNIMGLRVGSGLPNIQKDALSKMKFLYPSDHAEQIAIASILSDMDSEIESLEQKLDKTRQIKQGMMQQLLTGKIRLV